MCSNTSPHAPPLPGSSHLHTRSTQKHQSRSLSNHASANSLIASQPNPLVQVITTASLPDASTSRSQVTQLVITHPPRRRRNFATPTPICNLQPVLANVLILAAGAKNSHHIGTGLCKRASKSRTPNAPVDARPANAYRDMISRRQRSSRLEMGIMMRINDRLSAVEKSMVNAHLSSLCSFRCRTIDHAR